jgi:hypothetical protein
VDAVARGCARWLILSGNSPDSRLRHLIALSLPVSQRSTSIARVTVEHISTVMDNFSVHKVTLCQPETPVFILIYQQFKYIESASKSGM